MPEQSVDVLATLLGLLLLAQASVALLWGLVRWREKSGGERVGERAPASVLCGALRFGPLSHGGWEGEVRRAGREGTGRGKSGGKRKAGM